MKTIYLHIIFFLSLICNSYSQNNTLKVNTVQVKKEYTAGEDIELVFKFKNGNSTPLYIENSYGNTLIPPANRSNTSVYKLPPFISQKKGWNYWEITQNNHVTKGSFYIKPQPKIKQIETYLGPPSLLTGNNEYARLVVMPLDSFDNPAQKETPINILEDFRNNIYNTTIYSEGIIGYKLIDTEKKSGRKFLSVICQNTSAKELSLEILPNYPTNFNIEIINTHAYADGNQTIVFKTSVIKDIYDNIVANGTLVNFMVTNNLNQTFYTYGSTINGIATANIVHPNSKQTWNIKGFVNEICESNIIKFSFLNAVTEFDLDFDSKEKTLKIGPVKSYMNQFIPDGLPIKLDILTNNQVIKTLMGETEKGVCFFYLNNQIPLLKTYTLKISLANHTKTILVNGKHYKKQNTK